MYDDEQGVCRRVASQPPPSGYADGSLRLLGLRALSGIGVTLAGMTQMAHVVGWVDRIDESAVAVTDQMVRGGLGVQPPTVHVLLEGLDPPYVGYLTCRRFLRGRDAHGAVGVMGLLGSMLGASRLVVTYEHADLATALEDPRADQATTGVVVVDAGRDGHTLRWHPVLMTEGPAAHGGASTVRTEWGPAARYADAVLPDPVGELLAVWRAPRSWPETEFLKVYTSWELGGYSMRWVQRPVGERNQPTWMRLLAAVM